jgi:hypothetical protein
MMLPLFVFDGDDLSVFDSVDYASRYLEPIDVDNACYLGFDASGNSLRFEVIPGDLHSLPKVRIRRNEEPADPEQLRALLQARLIAQGRGGERAELADLAKEARNLFLVG